MSLISLIDTRIGLFGYVVGGMDFSGAKLQSLLNATFFFAEVGIGIEKDEEITSDKVREWCAPPKFNCDLSIGKEQKRIKLSFSKTTPSGTLPKNCLEVVPDIRCSKDLVMTDGCGLISQDGLDFVWRSCMKYIQSREAEYAEKQNTKVPSQCDKTLCDNDIDGDGDGCEENSDNGLSENNSCPYTSFQGRIGGFKGMWVLDDRLDDGIKVVCRDSQKKINFPMRSLMSFSDDCKETGVDVVDADYDSFYDTVDVCSWDKHSKEGRLSRRIIQILEYRGVDVDFFRKCADDGTKWLCRLHEDSNSLLEYISKRHMEMTKRHSNNNSDIFHDNILFRMASAKMDINEPIYAQKILQLVKKEADTMREKGRYPLRKCKQMRLIPDHTQILKEGEAFIAVGYPNGKTDQKNVEKYDYIVTLRSPAYFGGDLLKLKLVNKRTLRSRCVDLEKSKGVPSVNKICSLYDGPYNDPFRFFDGLHTGLVINSRGERSAADMMSGGDYDGDEAWVCWDKQLCRLVQDHPAQDTSTNEFIVKKSHHEKVLASRVSLKQRAEFALHYRYHQTQLGKLSTALDSAMDQFGVDSPESIAVATQAFLQVDHPYKLCEMKQDHYCELMEVFHTSPHWRGEQVTCRSYVSEKVLGVLYDYVQGKIDSLVTVCNDPEKRNTRLNPHIMSIINTARQKGLNDFVIERKLSQLQTKMKSAINEFYSEYKKLRATLKDDNEYTEGIMKEWMKYQHYKWRKELIDSEDGEDAKNLASAILYEETWRKSIESSFQGEYKVSSSCVSDRLFATSVLF
uniref:RNA-dependent RNA polymerase n=1 Tax=Ditylum brightwellii TaxID=49249 RepID=A0A7S4VSM7_9STRA